MTRRSACHGAVSTCISEQRPCSAQHPRQGCTARPHSMPSPVAAPHSNMFVRLLGNAGHLRECALHKYVYALALFAIRAVIMRRTRRSLKGHMHCTGRRPGQPRSCCLVQPRRFGWPAWTGHFAHHWPGYTGHGIEQRPAICVQTRVPGLRRCHGTHTRCACCPHARCPTSDPPGFFLPPTSANCSAILRRGQVGLPPPQPSLRLPTRGQVSQQRWTAFWRLIDCESVNR